MKADQHPPKPQRRVYPDELKQEAVQMLLDGHSAPSVARNLGIRHTSLLYRWKAEALGQQGQVASTLEARVRQLQEQLRRTEPERGIIKKTSAHFRMSPSPTSRRRCS